MENKNNYFPQLDGLRFFAFLAVFIHHAPTIDYIPGWQVFSRIGWIGVDLFLCLSAFLFAHLLHMEFEKTGAINALFFYARRALRIWPAYGFTLVLSVFFSIFLYGIAGFNLVRLLGLATFTDNFFAVFGGFKPLAVAGHLWTISYEEQVYLFIPIFLGFLFPKSLRFQVMVMLVLIGMGTVLRALFIAISLPHPAIWVLPITHFESVLLGLLIGLGAYDPVLRKMPGWLIVLASFSMLRMIALLPSGKITSWHLMILYPLAGLSMSLLLYAAIRFKETFWITWLGCKPLAYLGKISYGLYLYHLLALLLIQNFVKYYQMNLGTLNVPFIFFSAFFITLGMAVVSFELIEKPFLVLKKKFSIIASRPV